MRIAFRGDEIDLSGKIDQAGECWLWLGSRMNMGYGRISVNGREHLAHRLLFEALVGPITSDTLDHLCRVRHCVNPSHLEPVSRGENVLRGNSLPAMNARKTCCPRGHPFLPPNLYVTKLGYRDCRACHSEKHKAQYVKIPPHVYSCCICGTTFQTKKRLRISAVCSIPCRTKHYSARKRLEGRVNCS